MKEELILKFITLQQQFRLLHWQTKSHAQHIAYGDTYNSLEDLIDTFIEIYMGKYGRVEFTNGEGNITLFNLSNLDLNAFIKDNIKWVKSLGEKLNQTNDTDLLNVKDEIMASLNKLRYLLTLK
jgi:hypothetical protein